MGPSPPLFRMKGSNDTSSKSFADICNKYLPQPWDDLKFLRFGVVIGPSRSGKMSAIREMCYKYPDGIIYFEIGEPKNFVNVLSRSVGMKTSPSIVVDHHDGCVYGDLCVG